MRKTIPVFVYQNQEYLGKYDSIGLAAKRGGTTPATVSNIMYGRAKKPYTQQGFSFSLQPLTDEEREKLPVIDTVKQGYTRVDGRACKQIVEDAVYDVDCKNPQVCYLQRNRRDRVEEFKTFLFTKFRERWLIIPKQVATLERQYIRESLNSFL